MYSASPQAANDMSTAKSIVRSEYLIDRYRVTFESGSSWNCVCAEFVQMHECRHTRESSGRRAAQALITHRVRSVDGTLVGFANRAGPEAL
jgi:hypothetical protein